VEYIWVLMHLPRHPILLMPSSVFFSKPY
jgi:hypothetical protein